LLAAIWGASFLFVRIAAPVIGPVATADLRMLIAGAALLAYYAVTGFDPQWRLRWRQYLAIGVLNSAVPFLLYAYAALELSVGLLAVLNATSPMWAALLGIVALREALTKRRLAGLIVGMAGVAIVSGPEASTRWLSIAAGLGAALCYALTGIRSSAGAMARLPVAWRLARSLQAACCYYRCLRSRRLETSRPASPARCSLLVSCAARSPTFCISD
jgi:drug/metabolite transporter (DMT)-like permease